MWPPPIKVTDKDQIPAGAIYVQTLDNGEQMYSDWRNNKLYALQPAPKEDK